MNEALSIHRSTRCLVKFVLAGLLTFTLSSNVFAKSGKEQNQEVDTPALVIEIIAGWGGFIHNGSPIPISVLIRNDSERNIEGVLTLNELSSGQEVSLGEVVVAPHTTRRVTSIRSMNNWIDCYASLRQGREVRWRRQLDLHTGKTFDADTNYVLFIDSGGRRLDLPGAQVDSTTKAAFELRVAGRNGRPLECLTVKPWQISNHPGPLFVAQTMIFAEGAAEKDLNLIQWEAVAEWMCQGGVIFVHSSLREIVERLIEASPLGTEPAVQKDSFLIRRFGTGAIYEYDRPLMTSDAGEIRQSIAKSAARFPKVGTSNMSNWTFSYSRPVSSHANRNRNLIIGLFVGYALITGGGALFLFRFSQKTIAVFTIVMVVGTASLAAILGGYLRMSKGDVRSTTVTHAGVGGLVQTGNIRVQSAGGRNTRIGILGERADLQYTGQADNEYYRDYGRARNSIFPAFDWQPSLEPNETDRYRINVPMSPWGRRQCHATAFRRESQRINVELKFEREAPSDQDDPLSITRNLKGTISIKLENRLPFHLADCYLIIGTTHDCPPESTLLNPNKNNNSFNMYQDDLKPVDDLIDLYHVQRINGPAPENTSEADFPADFKGLQRYLNIADIQLFMPRSPFRIPYMGSTNAFLVARVTKSPIISIDEQHSDFLLQQENHLFIQELSPDEIPESLKYSATQKSLNSSPAVEETPNDR